MLKEISAGAIVFKRNEGIKYLLLKPTKESVYWDLPKGNVERGEEILKTAQREIREETGLTNLQFFPQFKEKIGYFYRRNKELISKEVVFFLAEALDNEVKISHEHVDYRWFEFHDAIKKLRENSVKVIEKANELLRK